MGRKPSFSPTLYNMKTENNFIERRQDGNGRTNMFIFFLLEVSPT